MPPLILFLAKHPVVSKFDLSELRQIFCGAAPLGKEVGLELEARFSHDIVVTQGFGMTETSPVGHIDTGKNSGAVGNAVCNTLCKIVDLDSGEAVGPYVEGELCIKGPQVMKGYLKNQEATDEMIKTDGWLHTGDIGYYDDNGIFFISDRLKELIKYKGSQIAPAELEALVLGHEAVQDVAIVGIPDERSGEVPCAFVVKKPNSSVSEQDLTSYVADHVSPMKQLRGGVKFVDEIPRNPSGKILRRLIKEKYL